MNDYYTVRAVPWAGGWELHVDGVGVTQVERLEDADAMVRDFLATVFERDTSGVRLEIA